jgi:hypothetical protein
VRREELLYVHRLSQAGARVHELENMGYVIEHILEPGQRFVTYRLLGEPLMVGHIDSSESGGPKPRSSERDDPPLFAPTAHYQR